jgi:Zn-dependent protease with chaperone function
MSTSMLIILFWVVAPLLLLAVGLLRLRAAASAFADPAAGDRRARYQAGLARLRALRLLLLVLVCGWALGAVELVRQEASIRAVVLHLGSLGLILALGSWPFLRYRAQAMARPLGGGAMVRLFAGMAVHQAITTGVALLLVFIGVTLAYRASSTALAVVILMATSLLNVTSLFLLFPLIVRVLGRARPATDPALLRMIGELNALAGTSVDRVWVLPSPTGSLNAMVTGLSGRRPTVFVTDALLAQLSPPQLRAVLAHELAHVRKRHIVRALGTGWIGAIVYLGLVLSTLTLLARQGGAAQGPLTTAAVIFVASLLTDVLLKLPSSRRRETEADTLAASWVGTEALADALERLYAANLAAADYSLTEKIWASHPTLRTRLSQLQRS